MLDRVKQRARRVVDLDTFACWRRDADAFRDADRELAIHEVEQYHHPLPDHRTLDPAELEACGIDQVRLFWLGHTVVEEARLAEIVLEALAARADLDTFNRFRVMDVAAFRRRRQDGTAESQCVREVCRPTMIDLAPMEAIALVVAHRRRRFVDGDLGEVRTTQSKELRVQVREQPTL